MIPIINNKTLLLTIDENKKIIPVTIMAPVKAARKMAIKPVIVKDNVLTEPPKSNMTNATPNPAPPDIPKIDGPANGFLKAVCNIKPLADKAPPHKMAVNACGKRDSKIMNLHDSLP